MITIIKCNAPLNGLITTSIYGADKCSLASTLPQSMFGHSCTDLACSCGRRRREGRCCRETSHTTRWAAGSLRTSRPRRLKATGGEDNYIGDCARHEYDQ